MAEFVSFGPAVQISGALVLSVVVGMGDLARPILRAHGLDNPEANAWYPEQTFLNALREVANSGYGHQRDLFNSGRALLETAPYPQGAQNLDQALHLLGDYYERNRRYDAVTNWDVCRMRAGYVVCAATTPYPSDFEHGLLVALAERWLKGEPYSIRRDYDAPSRKRGDDSCTYIVRWGPALPA